MARFTGRSAIFMLVVLSAAAAWCQESDKYVSKECDFRIWFPGTPRHEESSNTTGDSSTIHLHTFSWTGQPGCFLVGCMQFETDLDKSKDPEKVLMNLANMYVRRNDGEIVQNRQVRFQNHSARLLVIDTIEPNTGEPMRIAYHLLVAKNRVYTMSVSSSHVFYRPDLVERFFQSFQFDQK